MPYLDYNSTTPVDDRVIQAMLPTFAESFGNPSSQNHNTGRIGTRSGRECTQIGFRYCRYETIRCDIYLRCNRGQQLDILWVVNEQGTAIADVCERH